MSRLQDALVQRWHKAHGSKPLIPDLTEGPPPWDATYLQHCLSDLELEMRLPNKLGKNQTLLFY